MGTEITAISIVAGKKIPGQMRDCNNSAVLGFICSRCMTVLL